MIVVATDGESGKGWCVGPWNSSVPVAVGYSDVGVAEDHVHDHMNEVYLVARGSATLIVAGREVGLGRGDVLVVEPGEEHTFVSTSADYSHFVVQAPFVSGDKRLTLP